MSTGRIHGIIPAAGLGRRFGGGRKQYQKIEGQTLIARVVGIFLQSQVFDSLVICLPSEDLPTTPRPKASIPIQVIAGGRERAESVYLGFKSLEAGVDDCVLIHDAARPLVTVELVRRVVLALEEWPAVIPVVPVSDTIKRVEGEGVTETLDRTHLRAVQTPQGFHCNVLRHAYQGRELGAQWTDEAMLVEQSGVGIHCIAGDPYNLKITRPQDLAIAQILLHG